MRETSAAADVFQGRSIQADVMDYVVNGQVGWQLDQYGRGIGRHFAEHFQDPSLVKPDLPSWFCRTPLIEGDDRKWYVVELCERLDSWMPSSMSCQGNATW